MTKCSLPATLTFLNCYLGQCTDFNAPVLLASPGVFLLLYEAVLM